MNGLANPVLKRELKVRIRIARIVPAMALRFACLGLIFLLVLLSRLGRGLLAFVLAETLLVLLFVPRDTCDIFAGNAGRGELRDLALTRLNSAAILLGKLTGANFYNCVVVVLSAFAMCTISLFHRNLHVLHLVRANVAILILMFASAVMSLAFSLLFRRGIFISAMLTYTLVLLLVGSVVVSGPIVEWATSPRVKTVASEVALFANPLVMTSRALGTVDIMRTEHMYRLADPIVGRGFTYPEWYRAGIMYLSISCLVLIIAFVGFSRFVRVPARLLGGL